jgi:hypothetical protein
VAAAAAVAQAAQPPPMLDPLDSDMAAESAPHPRKKRASHHHLESDSDYGVSVCAPRKKKRREAPQRSAAQLRALPDHVAEDLDGAPLISHVAI